MNEDSARALLHALVLDPEPPAQVDIDAARRRGRRRQRTLRAAIPAAALAAAVIAAGVIAAVPRPLSSGTERPVSPAAPTRPPVAPGDGAKAAPASFNPLVPYADFGWLPSGFTESASGALGFPFTSDPTTVDRAAALVPAGHTLRLTVSARGACPSAAGGFLTRASVPLAQVSCGKDGLNQFLETGPETEVNGRPAVYTDYGGGIAWEYAPGAWASVTTGMTKPVAAPSTPAARSRQLGWVPVPGKGAYAAAIKSGKLIPPSAATQALLAKVASRVRFGMTTPVRFPFRLSGALPAGWRLTSLSFQVSGATLVSGSVSAGPAADTSALSLGAAWADVWSCSLVPGESSYTTRYGVSWVYRIIDEPGTHVQAICSTGKPTLSPTGLPDGLEVSVSLDSTAPGSSAPLPGSGELGGPFGVYARMSLLGTDPGGWTTRPVG